MHTQVCAHITNRQGWLQVLIIFFFKPSTQPVPLAGTAAAEGAKHRDKNSSVLLFEAALLLKIEQGGSTGSP